MLKKTPKAGRRERRAPVSDDVEALRRELADARKRISELEAHANEDPLTGLLNRRGFDKELERAFAFVRRYGTSVALLYLDLDRFKPINDTHGHGVGDAVLKEVVRLVCSKVRASDVVARVGGDEFVVLMWNLRELDAEARARALERLVEETPLDCGGKRLKLGVSIGLSYLQPQDTLADFVRRGDEAMYARKRERKTGR
ncbi:MAG TPA: GGDEF domain-containing protein [Xanthobacteraceae bacterium]|nr:GGDEF domain-containing protein [Xanthobacteraceae bacterium]